MNITLTLGCDPVTETKLNYTRIIAEGLNNMLVTSTAVSRTPAGFVYSRRTCKTTSTITAPALMCLGEPMALLADMPLDYFFFPPLGSILTILERNFRKDTEKLSDLK